MLEQIVVDGFTTCASGSMAGGKGEETQVGRDASGASRERKEMTIREEKNSLGPT